MSTSSAFDQAYRRLNPAQRQAVDHVDGPVMVVAGPGTGKTQVLATRVAHIMATTDVQPSAILALTFTDAAAKNMRERIVALTGTAGYYVQIHTFHSFCAEVIATHPEFFPLDRDTKPLTELERYAILENLVKTLPLEVLRPLNAPYFFVRDIISALSTLKREGVGPDELAAMVQAERELLEQEGPELKKTEVARREKAVRKQSELVELYRGYQQALRERQRFDFDDMIMLVVEAFSQQPELLAEYQERLLYLLVDEYQDTNTAQNKVVDLLASFWGEAANVFVVGDPHQAIFRFQGASLENVLSFQDRYPQATVITLTQGYRSPQAQYDAAAGLIAHNQQVWKLLSNEALHSQRALVGDEYRPTVFAAPSDVLEAVYVARRARALLDQGVVPSEIAILYRNHSDAHLLLTTLAKWEVPYELDAGENILKLPHIAQFVQMCRAVNQLPSHIDDGSLFSTLMLPWWGLPSLVVMQLSRGASQAKSTLYDYLRQDYQSLKSNQPNTRLTALDFSLAQSTLETMQSWVTADQQLTVTAWFEKVMSESGFTRWMLEQPEKGLLLNAVQSLLKTARAWQGDEPLFSLSRFLQTLDTLEAHGLAITLDDLNLKKQAVRLTTVHRAKGQEWDHVFVIRCVNGKWGNTRSKEMIPLPSGILQHQPEIIEENQDERRLFYVAITRAKKTLTLTYPESIASNQRSTDQLASMFLSELGDDLVPDTSQLAEETMTQAEAHLARLIEPAQTVVEPGEAERAFFGELVESFVLSPSTLNLYLRSPAEFVQKVLLKVPQAPAPQLAFGTAVHAALEFWYKAVMKGEPAPALESVITTFKQVLSKQELTPEDYRQRLSHGQEALTAYYEARASEQANPLYLERFFGSGWSRAYLDDIPLTGRVDRVDWIDQTAKTVRVIDYKTGRPKTLGEIEATVKSVELSEREQALPESIRGPYKRQLLFYKLLSELDPTFIPHVTEGVFEFVEPDSQSKKLVRRVLPLLDEEVEELKTLIREVMAEIRSLAFISTLAE